MPRLLLLNHVVLLLCCSIYLGTGVSLVIFLAPVAAASHFFTAMTIVMLICGLIMLATEWLSGLRWVPAIVLVAVILAAGLTMFAIAPLNARIVAGTSDLAELKNVVQQWSRLVRIRAVLWTVEWIAMAYWFYRLAYLARADR